MGMLLVAIKMVRVGGGAVTNLGQR